MSEPKKKLGWEFWVPVVLAILVLYVLTAPVSELLVLQIVFRGWIGEDHRDSVIAVIRGFYAPVHWLEMNGPWPINSVLEWYYRIWLPPLAP
jgi:hypothetical protein